MITPYNCGSWDDRGVDACICLCRWLLLQIWIGNGLGERITGLLQISFKVWENPQSDESPWIHQPVPCRSQFSGLLREALHTIIKYRDKYEPLVEQVRMTCWHPDTVTRRNLVVQVGCWWVILLRLRHHLYVGFEVINPHVGGCMCILQMMRWLKFTQYIVCIYVYIYIDNIYNMYVMYE